MRSALPAKAAREPDRKERRMPSAISMISPLRIDLPVTGNNHAAIEFVTISET